MSRTITVVWMDDRIEVYDGAEATLSNDVLHIRQYTGITRALKSEHHLPIQNIRDWYSADPEY